MTASVVVILAAGQGTRMRSAVPKVLHPICGRPMILWPIEAAHAAGAARVVVVDGPDGALAKALPGDVEVAIQSQPRGTGDAARAAAAHIDPDAPVVVLNGDVPLISADTIASLQAAHADTGAAATIATMTLDDPGRYGRVVRAPDGSVERVAEAKSAGDATEAELAIREVNTGVFAFQGAALLRALEQIRPANAQGEYYLPDVLPALRAADHPIFAFEVHDPTVTLGVNDRAELAAVRALAQRRIHADHMRAGVTIVDPATTLIDVDVQLGQDTVVEPGSCLYGATRAGVRCRIGPHATMQDAVLHDDIGVLHSHLVRCEVHDGASVGPFAYLRPGAVLREGSKAGTFVEVKNSDIGPGAKVPHLSYVGDAEVGAGANLGAATITANYDGVRKQRTTIGPGVRGGVDVTLVAPVTVGKNAYTAAGSVITRDVPPGALGVARERQRNIDGYAKRRKEEAP